ncbi:PREDICTED: sialin-like [Priapulus caudatus]|uniref:Sialin-like n=1 Tax=Priapulus caudatus TaxID=37621 RepID=A0ABM1F352_PRICU|nr:PREDICTED: sialin-like [Priapulus caudatus]
MAEELQEYSERSAIKKTFSQESDSRQALFASKSDQACAFFQRFPKRYLLAVMAFLGFCNAYTLRVNLSIAIVAMTTNRTQVEGNGTSNYAPDFPWDSHLRGYILGAFFYGYIITQIPGGWLASKVGGKILFGVGVAGAGMLSLLIPICTEASVYLLIACRVLQGLFEGMAYPSIHALWSNWAPPLERSRLSTIAFSGSYLGAVIAMPLSGILAEKLSWQSVFYVFGVLAVLWFVAWAYLVVEVPSKHPTIGVVELEYIQSSIGFTHDQVVVSAGFASACPYLVMGILLQMGGHLADWMCKQGTFTTTQVRKIFNCGGFYRLYAPVVMILAATTRESGGRLSPAYSIAVVGGSPGRVFGVIILDIAPQFASVLMGLSNCFATIPGIISPTVTGYLVKDKSPGEWQVVFYIAAVVYVVGAVFYGFFGSGERQQWADVPNGYNLCEEPTTEEVPYGSTN